MAIKLYAEDMSLKGRNAISNYVAAERLTSCPADTIVRDENHLEELKRLYPLQTAPTVTGSASAVGPAAPATNVAAAPVASTVTATNVAFNVPDQATNSSQKKRKAKGNSKSRRKSNSSSNDLIQDPLVTDAIKEIGGLLTSLSLEQRNAVLKKVNGAFGFNPKPKGKKDGKGGKPVQVTAKSDDNAKFARSFEGLLLEETSKEMKKLSRSKNDKPSTELYALHKELLTMRAQAKTSGQCPPVCNPDGVEPKTIVDDLLSGYRKVSSHCQQANITPTARDIFTGSLCLLRGQVPAQNHPLFGINPDKATWEKATRKVPRTIQEAAERASQILASKKQRQERKKSTDNQNSLRKRRKPNPGSSADQTPTQSAAVPLPNMVVEVANPVTDGVQQQEDEETDSKMPPSGNTTMGDTVE
jgi:hypothetical protein